jgi:hypothetical protein
VSNRRSAPILPSLEVPAIRELAAFPQWVCWRLEKRGGKATKVPVAISGSRASSIDPRTWSSFEEATTTVRARADLSGVGFVFTSEDPFVGVDLDHVISKAGELEPTAREIVELLDSYTETSQSSEGLHVIVRTSREFPSGARRGNLEAYSSGRYFCMTGQVFGNRQAIADRDDPLRTLLERHLRVEPPARGQAKNVETSKPAKPDQPAPATGFPAEKFAVLLANSIEFQELWEHRRQPQRDATLSGYDLALCHIAAEAEWTDSELAALIDQHRTKYGTAADVKKGRRADYIERTIGRARKRAPTNPWSSCEAGPYAVEGGAIAQRKTTRDGVESSVPLCNFSARIVEERVRDDGVERRPVFVIAGETARGVALPQVEVPASQFAALGWVLDGWGTRALVYAGTSVKDHLRAAIQALSGEVASSISYTHTGWRNDGDQWFYLHAGGAMGAAGLSASVNVDLPSTLDRFNLPAPAEGDRLREALRVSASLLDVAPDRVTATLHAALVRAVMGEADFSVHLAGPTGARKTALAAVIQSHFGAEFDERHVPGSWSSTSNALEALLFTAKDALVVIDDFAPRGSSSDQQRYHREADRVFRNAGNRAGRARMNRDLSMRPEKPPRALALSTGEEIPTGHSVRARLVVLELGPSDMDLQNLANVQRAGRTGLLAEGLAAFLRWLAPQFEEARREHREASLAWRERAFAHGRTADALGQLAAAHTLWRRFAVEVGALSVEDATRLASRVESALLEAGAAQSELQRSEDPVGRFFELLVGAIAAGEAHLEDADREEEPPRSIEPWKLQPPARFGWRRRQTGTGEFAREELSPQGSRIGWVRGPALYLEPEAAFREAQRFAFGQGQAIPISQRTLWKRLAERGLLLSMEKGRHTSRPMIHRDQPRVIHLDARVLLSPTSGLTGLTGLNGGQERGEGVRSHSPIRGERATRAGWKPTARSPENAPRVRIARSARLARSWKVIRALISKRVRCDAGASPPPRPPPPRRRALAGGGPASLEGAARGAHSCRPRRARAGEAGDPSGPRRRSLRRPACWRTHRDGRALAHRRRASGDTRLWRALDRARSRDRFRARARGSARAIAPAGPPRRRRRPPSRPLRGDRPIRARGSSRVPGREGAPVKDRSAERSREREIRPPVDLAGRLSLRPAEAARALGVSERTLRTMLPRLPHVRLEGCVLLPVEALRRWLEAEAKAREAHVEHEAKEIMAAMRDRSNLG